MVSGLRINLSNSSFEKIDKGIKNHDLGIEKSSGSKGFIRDIIFLPSKEK